MRWKTGLRESSELFEVWIGVEGEGGREGGRRGCLGLGLSAEPDADFCFPGQERTGARTLRRRKRISVSGTRRRTARGRSGWRTRRKGEGRGRAGSRYHFPTDTLHITP